MTEVQKRSNVIVIVVHEIYGINAHMRYVCEMLSRQGFDTVCPDLLKREAPFEYNEEASAYEYFMKHVGFELALKRIHEAIEAVEGKYDRIYIAGFSAGATVAWLCSEAAGVNGVAAFYGSRIRSYKEIDPQCPVLLLFPEREQSFDVDELMASLSGKEQVQMFKFKGEHGFSDPFGPKFMKQSAQDAYRKMIDWISKH